MTDVSANLCSEVYQTAGGFYARDRQGATRYIRHAGKVVRAFNAGWTPLFVYAGLPGFYLLELQHQSGRRATWFLDEGFARLSDAVGDLPPRFREILRDAAQMLQADLWAQLMLAPAPRLQLATREFFRLNELTRAQVHAAVQEAAVPDPAVVDLSTDAMPTYRCGWEGHEELLQRVLLEAIFRAPITDRFIEACATGKLSWPSPIDGAPMRLLGGLFLDDFRFAYRMLDVRTGLVVVPVITEHYRGTIAIYLPHAGLLIVPDAPAAKSIQRLLGGLVAAFERHFWRYATVLESYFNSEAFTFASLLRGRPGLHLGHQLWNELTAIEQLVNAVPPERLPLFLVPNAPEGTEIYGPLDALFPKLVGRVQRFNCGVAEIVSRAYERRLCVARLTNSWVPASLRDRILTFAYATASGHAANMEADAISRGGLPIILLGLRVENRTLVDLEGFITALIERMLDRIGAAVFVIDGINQRVVGDSERTFEVNLEHLAVRRPLDVEREIAAALKAHFAGTQAHIISTIGAPIHSSLVWADRSRMFVAIWGAGLAKYRWVANKPGFVVSSAWSLRHRPDLHIYDAPRFMEVPTEIVFADATLVRDRPDKRPILMSGSRVPLHWVNFDVQLEALWPAIEIFLIRLGL